MVVLNGESITIGDLYARSLYVWSCQNQKMTDQLIECDTVKHGASNVPNLTQFVQGDGGIKLVCKKLCRNFL